MEIRHGYCVDKVFSGTAEVVGRGHPDKIADAIAEKLTGHLLEKNPTFRAGIEVLASHNYIVVGGEIHGRLRPDEVQWAANSVLSDLKYDTSNLVVVSRLQPQSNDLELVQFKGVKKKVRSGDQSIVTGCASVYGTKFLPIAYTLAQGINKELDECITSGDITGVTHDYKIFIHVVNSVVQKLVISIQHEEQVRPWELRRDIKAYILNPIFDVSGVKLAKGGLHINMGGQFTVGGLMADTGVTNRKITCDTYGVCGAHGGGGLCGKDLTKVDRLGAYFARYICKNLVCAGACDYIELRLKFLPGQASFTWDIMEVIGYAYSIDAIDQAIETVFHDNYTFNDIYAQFNDPYLEGLDRLAVHGHFTSSDYPWEKTDKVSEIQSVLAIAKEEEAEEDDLDD